MRLGFLCGAALAIFACSGGDKTDSSAGSAAAPSAGTPTASAASSAGAPPDAASSADAPEVVIPSEGDRVLLDGTTRPAPPKVPGPQLAAKAMLVAVYERPSDQAKKLGFLRAGATVTMLGDKVSGAGCSGGFRAISPAGFVCQDDKVTEDLQDPIVRAMSRGPDIEQSLPYMYGIVTRGGPAYSRLPTKKELEELEPNLGAHIDKWKKDKVSGASYGLELWYKWRADKPSFSAEEAYDEKLTDPEIPFYLKDGGQVPNLSGLVKGTELKLDGLDRRQGKAFVESFLWEGRRYLVTTDLRVMPADRFRPIRGSEHKGVEIGKDVELPFAIVRKKYAKKYVVSGKGLKEDGDVPYRAAFNLTGKQRFSGGVLHYETKEGFFLSDRHASRVDPAKRMPKWGKNGERWLDVNISKQVLVAYEGEKPVFATIVSTGEDGLKEGSRSTLKGIFRVHTKHISTTMDSDVVGEEFELRDVPYVQYFEGGYALHGAYWHDNFGTPKSHGCINLSPEDARRLFYFTKPEVPAGFHGAMQSLTGTVVFVHP